MKKHSEDKLYRDLSTLFFETRQIIRGKLPKKGNSDPNAWLRCETLRFVKSAESPTMQEIAQFLRITAPSATSLIAYLEKLGMLVRIREPEDKRVVRISLTKQGERELSDYDKRCARTMAAVFQELPPREVRELRRILNELRRMHG